MLLPLVRHVPRALLALVLDVSRALRAPVPDVPRALCALDSHVLCALRALMSHVPLASCTLFSTCSHTLHPLVPYLLLVPRAFASFMCQYRLFCSCFLILHIIFSY